MKKISKTGESEHTYGPYNTYGEAYIEGQRNFYEDEQDPSRAFIEGELIHSVEGKTLLDVGCGAGDDLVQYANMGAEKVIGVEPSDTMRHVAEETLAEKTGLPIELYKGEFEKIPLENESVDIVVSRFSFHIQSHFEESFEEIARVLKPEGLFILATAHPDNDARIASKQGKEIGDRILVKLFNDTVIVDNGTHTMDEYLGVSATKYFECTKTEEHSVGQASEGHFTDLYIVYKKRHTEVK